VTKKKEKRNPVYKDQKPIGKGGMEFLVQKCEGKVSETINRNGVETSVKRDLFEMEGWFVATGGREKTQQTRQNRRSLGNKKRKKKKVLPLIVYEVTERVRPSGCETWSSNCYCPTVINYSG